MTRASPPGARRVDLDAIDRITIASPCTVPWESMSGDDAKRFCGQCRLHVHDFSQMTRAEIADLLHRTGGNCCKRIWRRRDGRIITKDCRRVLDGLRRRARAFAAAVAGLLAFVGLGGCSRSQDADSGATAGAAPSDAGAGPSNAGAPSERGVQPKQEKQ